MLSKRRAGSWRYSNKQFPVRHGIKFVKTKNNQLQDKMTLSKIPPLANARTLGSLEQETRNPPPSILNRLDVVGPEFLVSPHAVELLLEFCLVDAESTVATNAFAPQLAASSFCTSKHRCSLNYFADLIPAVNWWRLGLETMFPCNSCLNDATLPIRNVGQ